MGLAAFRTNFSHPYSSSSTSSSHENTVLSRFVGALAPAGDRRVVYPYSVVPGGVQSPEELKQASDNDRLVAQHYAGFDYRRARVIEVREPRLVYLSYRLHNHIYWTSKQIRLHRGERLISDGHLTARSRCGNQVSDTAQKATSREEPPAEKFEQPFLADGGTGNQGAPAEFASTLHNAPQFDGAGSTAPIASSYLFGPGASNGFPTIFAPPIPINSVACNSLDPGAVNHHCPKHPGTGGGPTPPPPPPPPPAVPEPGTLFLFGSGAIGLYLRYRKSMKK